MPLPRKRRQSSCLILIALMLLYALLAAALGMLFWVLVALVLVAVISAIGRSFWQGRQKKQAVNVQPHKKAEQKVEAALKDLERKINS